MERADIGDLYSRGMLLWRMAWTGDEPVQAIIRRSGEIVKRGTGMLRLGALWAQHDTATVILSAAKGPLVMS